MPRYFFHLRDGQDLPDDIGTELPDLSSARTEAVRLVSKLLAYDNETFWNGQDWHLEVTNEAQVSLFKLRFLAANMMAAVPLQAH